MASATERKPFSAQPSAPPTLSAMLFGISSFCAWVWGSYKHQACEDDESGGLHIGLLEGSGLLSLASLKAMLPQSNTV